VERILGRGRQEGLVVFAAVDPGVLLPLILICLVVPMLVKSGLAELVG